MCIRDRVGASNGNTDPILVSLISLKSHTRPAFEAHLFTNKRMPVKARATAAKPPKIIMSDGSISIIVFMPFQVKTQESVTIS